MTSPNGTVTTTGEGVLDGDGDSMEIVHKVFTDEWGIFTIVVHTYDAAGNVSTTTRTIERKPEDPDPADGIGGGGSGSNTSFAWPNVSVYVYSNGTYTETGATVATPKNVLGSYNNNLTFNIHGNALSVGHPATIKVTYQSLDKVIQDRCKNYGRFMSVCISALQGQILRTSIDKSAKVSESYVRVIDHDTGGFLDEFANSASFSKNNISISSTSHKIRAASKIKIAGAIAGTNFSNSSIHQGYSTDPVILVSGNIEAMGDNAPRGLPVDNWQDSNIGQGPGGGFSHTDGQGHSISAVDIAGFGLNPHVVEKSTMHGEAELRRNMPPSDLSGTCSNTHPAAKVWGCYVVVTNSSTGYMTINAHLDYTDSMAKYKSFGVTMPVENRSEIGLMGNTGYSTNSHAHYEIRRGPVGTTTFYDGIPYLGSTQDEQRLKMSELTGLSVEQLSR